MISDPDMMSQQQNLIVPGKTFRSSQRGYPGRILPQALLASIPLLASLGVLLVGRPSQSAVRALVVIMFVCALALFFQRLRAGRGLASLASTALILSFLFWYAYPAVVVFWMPGYVTDSSIYSFVSDENIVKAIAMLSFFLFGATLALALDHKQTIGDNFAPKSQTPSPVATKRLIFIAITASILGMLPLVVLGSGLENIPAAIVESRAIEKAWLQNENLGDSTSPFTFIASSALIAGVALLWLAVLDSTLNRLARMLILAFALAVTTVVYFDQGTRANLVLILLPATLMILTRTWKRSRTGVIALILVFITAGIVVLQFQTLYRTSITRDRTSELLFENWFTLGGTIDFFSETVFAVSIVPTYHDFFRESSATLFLVSPIPRFLWPSKPFSELIRFYVLMRWNIDVLTQAGNTFPGIVGQYYMSWGWFGPLLIGSLFGLLASRLDRFLARVLRQGDTYLAAVAIMGMSWMILSYRNLSPTYLYSVAFCALYIWASRRIVARSRPQPAPLESVSTSQRSLHERKVVAPRPPAGA